MEFRPLRADEVDVRIGQQMDNGDVILLLYKDARCDMNILDEFGVVWQRKHYECKGNLFCSVGIYNSFIKEWVWKDDCGTESYTEKEKGEASDSFKRACFNWGIGRELYTAPFIYIKADKLKFAEDKDGKVKKSPNGKPICKTKFRVKDMVVENGKIVRLCICDEKGNDLFTEGYAKTKKDDAIICEGCGNPLTAIMGNDGKFISISKVAETSKEATKKTYGEEHILCAECIKDKEVLKRVINGHKG